MTQRRFRLSAFGSALILEIAASVSVYAEPVRVVLLTPAMHHVAPNGLVPIPMSVRVERASGEVIPGAVVTFQVNVCVELSGSFTCPVSGEYGGFETGAVPSPMIVQVTTGSDGVATAPLFRAGTPTAGHAGLTFTVFPFVPAQTTAGGITISLSDALHPITPLGGAATTIVISQDAHNIPSVSATGLILLGFVLATAAAARLR